MLDDVVIGIIEPALLIEERSFGDAFDGLIESIDFETGRVTTAID